MFTSQFLPKCSLGPSLLVLGLPWDSQIPDMMYNGSRCAANDMQLTNPVATYEVIHLMQLKKQLSDDETAASPSIPPEHV